MADLIQSVPAAILIPAALFLVALLAYLVVRSLGEGREVSFWLPRIGPRLKHAQDPDETAALLRSVAADSSQRAGNTPAVASVGHLPSVMLSAEPIALLRLIAGKGQGTCFVVTAILRSITVGRSTDCDLAIDDHSLTRHHFRINVKPVASDTLGARRYQFSLVDARSTNGTFVNGNRVQEIGLGNGDLVEAGGVSLRFFQLGTPVSGQQLEGGA